MGYMRVWRQDSISELLNDLLYREAPKTTLIVCTTRKIFLQQLLASISARRDHSLPLEEPDWQLNEAVDLSYSETLDEQNPLLNRTIGLIARSRKIKILFCPSVETTRALLSTLHIRYRKDLPLKLQSSSDDQWGTIAIVDIVALHYPTTEFSAQGLSKTFAIAVETAAKMNAELLLCECGDAVDAQNAERGSRLWELHAPLLNGASRRIDGQHNWTGRHVSVRSIVQRWFVFEGEQDMNV